MQHGYRTISGQTIYNEIKSITDRISQLKHDISRLEDDYPPHISSNQSEGIRVLKSKLKDEEKKVSDLKNTKYITEQQIINARKEDNDG